MSTPANVLVIDDDAAHADSLGEALQAFGHEARVVHSGQAGLDALADERADVILTDLRMNDVDGMDILAAARKAGDTDVILITGHGSVQSAVKAMAAGAAHYLTKPVNIAELRTVLERVLESRALARRNTELEAQLDERFGFDAIIGASAPLKALFRTMRQVAPTDVTVLITGESGTGKELVARALHQNSRRSKSPLVTLNCAALPESLLESELFGHEKGAFTGAAGRKIGFIEYAEGGTLFLDEVGDMPLTTQVKMLRVLEQREIVRLGSNQPIPVDVRVIAATNKNLLQEVSEGRFREDLYFRLKVVSLQLPPLRERQVDIPRLTEAFLAELSERHRSQVRGVSPEVMRVLQAQAWPGNVRELRNVVENMVVTGTHEILQPSDLPPGLAGGPEAPVVSGDPAGLPLAGLTAKELEKEHIRQTLEKVGGHRKRAAQLMGIGERTLFRKIKEYDLT
ncbi:MAG: sigma-54-dependent Fis family transcriptional regulator [Planctomycetota bacterium]|nr:MAG: sigma-54-dependent Fis family transcriptional regulator [Planctomycetota bacterium]